MNPLIERYRRSHMRPTTLRVFVALYAVLLVLMTLVAAPRPGVEYALTHPEALRAMARSLYAQLWAVEVGLGLWAAVQSASVIPREIERRSFDFFRLLPLSAGRKVVALCVGPNLSVLVLVALDLVLITIAAGVAGVEVAYHFELQALTLSAMTLAVLLGLLASTLSSAPGASSKARAVRIGVSALLGFMVSLFVVAFAQQLASGGERPDLAESVGFFGMHAPAYVVALVVVAYLAVWAYLGVVRRLRDEDEPLFSRRAGVVFVAVSAVLAYGWVWDPEPARPDPWEPWVTFVLLTSFPLLSSSVGARVSVAHYLERRGSVGDGVDLALARRSNLVTDALLAGVATLGWLLAAVALGTNLTEAASCVALALVTFAFLALLFETNTLYRAEFAHTSLVTAFVFFAYVLFPAVATLTTGGDLFLLSGLDTLFVYARRPGEYELGHAAVAVVVNATYCALLAALVVLRYRRLGNVARSLSRA